MTMIGLTWTIAASLLAACVAECPNGVCADKVQHMPEAEEVDEVTLLQVHGSVKGGSSMNLEAHSSVNLHEGLERLAVALHSLAVQTKVTTKVEDGRAAPCSGSGQFLDRGEGDETYWRCYQGGMCIPSSYRCNGIKECKDGSDELLCMPQLKTTLTNIEVAIANGGMSNAMSNKLMHLENMFHTLNETLFAVNKTVMQNKGDIAQHATHMGGNTLAILNNGYAIGNLTAQQNINMASIANHTANITDLMNKSGQSSVQIAGITQKMLGIASCVSSNASHTCVLLADNSACTTESNAACVFAAALPATCTSSDSSLTCALKSDKSACTADSNPACVYTAVPLADVAAAARLTAANAAGLTNATAAVANNTASIETNTAAVATNTASITALSTQQSTNMVAIAALTPAPAPAPAPPPATPACIGSYSAGTTPCALNAGSTACTALADGSFGNCQFAANIPSCLAVGDGVISTGVACTTATTAGACTGGCHWYAVGTCPATAANGDSLVDGAGNACALTPSATKCNVPGGGCVFAITPP